MPAREGLISMWWQVLVRRSGLKLTSMSAGRDARVCLAQGMMFPGPTAGALAAAVAVRSAGVLSASEQALPQEKPTGDRTHTPQAR